MEEDDLATIDPSNIIDNGRRTRGKEIDWSKTDAADQMDDDDDDDEDFAAPDEKMQD